MPVLPVGRHLPLGCAMSLLLMACPSSTANTPPAVTPPAASVLDAALPDPLAAIAQRFSDPGWKLQTDPFKDTAPIPQAGGLEYLPEQALGFVWAVELSPTLDSKATCRTQDVAALPASSVKIVPLGSYVGDRTKCRIKNIGDQQLYEFRTTGAAVATLSVGPFLNGGASANNAYEVLVDQPTHVTFEDPQSCIPTADLRKVGFQEQDRVCEVYWVHTVKQTKVYSKVYTEMKANTTGAFSVINIGGSVYSSSGQMSQVTVITGNHIDLTPSMNRLAASGYVVKSPDGAPPATSPAPIAAADIDRLLGAKLGNTKLVTVDIAREGLRTKVGPGVLAPVVSP